MVFSSVVFVLMFLPFVLIIHSALYLLLPDTKNKFFILNTFILLMSIIFYAWGEPKHLLIMLAVAVLDYFLGILIYKQTDTKMRKIIIFLGVTSNLCVLGYYKYMNFFLDTARSFNVFLPSSFQFGDVLDIALPLGISFYVFQGMSYLIDVYRGQVKPTYNIINFSSYLTMFPQLVAGPIVRYSSINSELIKREITIDKFALGTNRFIIGLAKKLLIADTLGKVVQAAFAIPSGELSFLGAWLGTLAFALQIYYDFSGYSDMAIGIGLMLGFTFPENFNYPYISRSVTEFWKRWHISLTTWFRDYLYFPLGGNRVSVFRTYANQLIVFTLCGLWHGATWLFLAWGVYQGSFLLLEKRFPNFAKSMPIALQFIYVIVVNLCGAVIFNSENFKQMSSYYLSMLGFHNGANLDGELWKTLYSGDVIIAFVVAIIFCIPIYPYVKAKCEKLIAASKAYAITLPTIRTIMLIGLLLICLMPLFGSTFQTFIYFRF